MKKNLYYLDNEERNRILNIHENRSRSQYLTVLKDDLHELSNNVDKTYFLGVSPDENIFFTNKNLYVNEGDELKKLEYDLDSLPYILETARKKCDKMLLEGNMTLNKYLSVPQKFLMSLMEEWDLNKGVRQEINEHWNNKFKDSIKLLTENRKLIFENNLNYQLWEEVNLIANQIIVEQGWNPFSKDFAGYKAAKKAYDWGKDKLKKAGTAVQKGWESANNALYKAGEWFVKGISKAAGKLLNWVVKQGIIPALRWIRRNLNSYIGMITEIIASMFPTVVVVKAIWCMIVILDIYEILTNDYDPKDPDRKKMPFIGLITDLISLFTTGAVGAGSKAIFKTAAKEVASGGVVSSQAKGLLTTIVKSLPALSSTLKYVQNIITKWFGKSAGDFLGKIFNGIDSVVTKLFNWIKKTFNLNDMGESIVQTVKQARTKQGIVKAGVGTAVGVGFATFMKENSFKKGDTDPKIKEAKEGLVRISQTPLDMGGLPTLNYKGPIDNKFDQKMEDSIKVIQSYYKLPVTGILTPDIAMPLGVEFGPTNMEKILGKTTIQNFGQAILTANSWLEQNLGGAKGALSLGKKV